MSANLNTATVLDEIEAVLDAGRDARRCREALAILQRWQWDRDLDAPSRTRAASLLRIFGRRFRAKKAA
jgi:hypothetical protein